MSAELPKLSQEQDPENIPPAILPPAAGEPYYIQADESDNSGDIQCDEGGPAFDVSGAMAPIAAVREGTASARTTSPFLTTQKKKRKKMTPLVLFLISLTAVMLILAVVMTVFASPATHTTAAQTTTEMAPLQTTTKPKPGGKVTLPPHTHTPSAPTNAQHGQTPTTVLAGGGEIPPTLPAGWATAHLSPSDGPLATYTADVFSTREETWNFRSLGTRTQHAGTLTSATFLLTPNGKQRFAQNDRRVINNTFFDSIANHHLVQIVLDLHPTLLMVQVQNQQVFAWVDVAFHLWQSQVNGQGQQVTGLVLDPGTNQPHLYHMSVLLLHEAQQGSNAPAGGTDWLVSGYGLDLTSPLTIVQPA